MRIALALLICAGAIAAPSPAAAFSKAAEYLIAEQIKSGCEDGRGRFSKGVVERDLTGDGKPDLIIDHSGLTCVGTPRSQSITCGSRACNVYFYVREGALLVEKMDILSIGVHVGAGPRPRIRTIGHNFETGYLRVWTH